MGRTIRSGPVRPDAPHHEIAVTECPSCGKPARRGRKVCGECEAEEHMEQAMDNRMERGL